MDTFDQKNHARLELQFLSVELTESCNEIIFRHFHSLTGKQFQDITLEVFVVDCVKIIEIEGSVRKERSVETVHKIVVSRERDRLESAGLELDAETLAECRLSAA